ncbi:hypothetical protein Golax_009344, partial [Gossypium laxum]|nr:hypothetical protein [Gossypium laxum]
MDNKYRFLCISKASCKSTLLGASPNRTQNMAMEKDFSLIDRDVVIVVVD